jgi:hypothetical protein
MAIHSTILPADLMMSTSENLSRDWTCERHFNPQHPTQFKKRWSFVGRHRTQDSDDPKFASDSKDLSLFAICHLPSASVARTEPFCDPQKR